MSSSPTSVEDVVPSSPSPRSRAWNFRVPRFSEAAVDAANSIAAPYVVFSSMALESGERMIDGVVYFKYPVSALRLPVIPGGYWEVLEPLRVFVSINGIKKSPDCRERGVKPMTKTEKGQANKRRWVEAFAAAKDGRFDDIPDDIRNRFMRTLMDIREDHLTSLKK